MGGQDGPLKYLFNHKLHLSGVNAVTLQSLITHTNLYVCTHKTLVKACAYTHTYRALWHDFVRDKANYAKVKRG